jgi:hypothetical protein
MLSHHEGPHPGPPHQGPQNRPKNLLCACGPMVPELASMNSAAFVSGALAAPVSRPLARPLALSSTRRAVTPPAYWTASGASAGRIATCRQSERCWHGNLAVNYVLDAIHASATARECTTMTVKNVVLSLPVTAEPYTTRDEHSQQFGCSIIVLSLLLGHRFTDQGVLTWKISADLLAASCGLDSRTSALAGAPPFVPTRTASGSASQWPAASMYRAPAVALANASAPSHSGIAHGAGLVLPRLLLCLRSAQSALQRSPAPPAAAAGLTLVAC